jgi:hypothetical protein
MCGIATVAILFLAGAVTIFGILGFMGVGVVQRLCFSFGAAIIAFGFCWPRIEQYAGFKDPFEPVPVIAIRLANMNVVAEPVGDRFRLVNYVTFFNDGPDTVSMSDYSATGLAESGNDAKNIAAVRKIVADWVAQGSNSFYDHRPHEPSSIMISKDPIAKKSYDGLMAGRYTFYFAATVIYKLGQISAKREVCGYSTGPNLNLIHMCPDSVN